MMRSGGAYDRIVRGLSGIYIAIGLVLIVLTIARGGTPISIGFLMGFAFVAIGVGRIWFQRSMTGDE